MSSHPSDSSIQRNAETEILEKLSNELKCSLIKTKYLIGTPKPIEIDGFSESPNILCEVYAHIGKLNGAQYQKLLTDAMKMLLVEKRSGKKWYKYLVFADKDASRTFEDGTWCAKAVQTFGISIKVIQLKPETRAAVLAAQYRQKR